MTYKEIFFTALEGEPISVDLSILNLSTSGMDRNKFRNALAYWEKAYDKKLIVRFHDGKAYIHLFEP